MKSKGDSRAFNANWVLFVFQTIIKEIKFIPLPVSPVCTFHYSIREGGKKDTEKTRYENINQHVKLDMHIYAR